ncbi:class I tRNA ligase family protein, partial [Patescibacteria group bacterium]|nr:class I tRNA ligase family protein [Patescibacteria group bacterium]
KMYTFKYSKDFPFSIASTRPETKLGDTAVAVHPEDKRYKEYIGKEYSFEFAGEPITVTIIGDTEVDPEFGTGALGVTPAHSLTDWEMAQRHDLPLKQVINEYGKMMVGMDGVKDQKAAMARDAVVAWLRNENLLEKEEDIEQSIATAERTGGIIEPLPKMQWWIDVHSTFPYPHDSLKGIKQGQEVSLKDLMLHVVESGQVTIMPDRFDKTYRHWIENLRDWNISRQIFFGHQIPAWYPLKNSENSLDGIKVSMESPGKNWVQDEDTLDTWFSSGLWSFSTLGWPEQTDDFKTYHPTNILNPGYEILPLWVSRMILMSTFLVGDIPFREVYIHGMLRDKDGRKFSKSLNNGIDPLEVIEQYGTDALRMALTIGVTPGQDMSFDLQKVKAYSKFANKLWNIARFVLSETSAVTTNENPIYTPRDKELLDEQTSLIQEITREMNENKLYLVAEKLYHYVWHTFADHILEESKRIFDTEDNTAITSRKIFLRHSLKLILKTLHPFMPFITEEIWQSVKDENDRDILMTVAWPIL